MFHDFLAGSVHVARRPAAEYGPRAGQNRERLIFKQMAHLVYTKSAAYGASIRRGRTRTHHVTARKKSSITARFSKFSTLPPLPAFSPFPENSNPPNIHDSSLTCLTIALEFTHFNVPWPGLAIAQDEERKKSYSCRITKIIYRN